MKTFRFITLFCLALIGNSLLAQSQQELKQLMQDRGEYYFTLNVDDPAQIQELCLICSVDGTDGYTVVAYANQEEYDKLITLGYQPTLETPPSLRANIEMWDGNGTYNWNKYLTYPQYVAMMQGFPGKAISGRTCTLFSLGTLTTTNHRQLLGVRINNGSPEGKPKFLYSSTMHGDEVTGMILMLRLIDELCTSTDSQIVNLLDDVDIYILPLTNPDGTYNSGNSTVSGATRANGNNVDLNRNYKDYYKGDHPDYKAYQNETLWTMAFGDSLLFTMSANYHGGATVMNYPWDAVYDDHADKDWYEYVCTEYVQIARQVYPSYMSDTYSDGVTNGAAWYVITGSRQDYMNAYGQCREVTVECSTAKTPDASQLPNFWNYNRNSMLAFMEQARNGVHGFVYDVTTNQPIQGVTVTVQGHDSETSFVTTHSVGDFHRPIKGGSYTFVFSKEGYCDESYDVTVADGQRVDLEVYLSPEGSCAVAMDCYEQATAPTAGSYVMGYMSNSTLVMPTHNNASTVTTTSANVTPTEDGFSAESSLPQITLQAYGNNGQYYIKYGNRYLSKSSNSSSLTWSSSQPTSNNGRWYINDDGIYLTITSGGGWGGGSSTTTTYYLYYNSGSFQLSTTAQNNITFYTKYPRSQTVSFGTGWNWWAPTIGISLAKLETALGGNGIIINSQNNGFARYENEQWTGSLENIVPGQMYRIQTSAPCQFSFGSDSVPNSVTITIVPGFTWFGYTGAHITSISKAFGSGFTPTTGDKINSQDEGFAIYEGGTWTGSLKTLKPGHGYVYMSNGTEQTITFE